MQKQKVRAHKELFVFGVAWGRVTKEVVGCLTLMLRMLEVPDSNLGPDTGSYFVAFSQFLQENAGIITWLYGDGYLVPFMCNYFCFVQCLHPNNVLILISLKNYRNARFKNNTNYANYFESRTEKSENCNMITFEVENLSVLLCNRYASQSRLECQVRLIYRRYINWIRYAVWYEAY
jgi:hypothetical protein